MPADVDKKTIRANQLHPSNPRSIPSTLVEIALAPVNVAADDLDDPTAPIEQQPC